MKKLPAMAEMKGSKAIHRVINHQGNVKAVMQSLWIIIVLFT